MQSKRLCLVLACILLPLAGCDSTETSETFVARTFFMYGSDGEIIDLPVSTVVFSISFVEGLTDAEKESILATEPSVRSLADRVSSGDLEEAELYNFITIPIEPGLTAAQTLAMLERLSAREGVNFANPGLGLSTPPDYERIPNLHFVFGDGFSASFPFSTPREEIDALNTSFAVEVSRITERPSIDEVIYDLRVTEGTGFNAIDTANSYHVNPITITAQVRLGELAPAIYFLPEITLLSPEEDGVTTSDTLEILWFDRDPNDINQPDGAFPPDAEIRLFIDTDNEGRNGILIADGISEDDEDDSFLWDTTGFPTGTYFIFAEMYDRLWPPVYSYSPGPVHIVSR